MHSSIASYTIVLLFFLFFTQQKLNAQKSITSHTLSGEWSLHDRLLNSNTDPELNKNESVVFFTDLTKSDTTTLFTSYIDEPINHGHVSISEQKLLFTFNNEVLEISYQYHSDTLIFKYIQDSLNIHETWIRKSPSGSF